MEYPPGSSAGRDAATTISAGVFPEGGTALIFGATGGIGGALVAALTAEAGFARVHGAGRQTRLRFDLTDEDSIARLVEDVAAEGDIRLAIDATGLLSNTRISPEKSLRQITPAAMAEAFAINATGPALLMKHLLPRLPRRGRSVFATLSARVGSIGDNGLGGWYAYRAAKAALNQILRSAAIELRRTHPDAICMALHPGTVDTGLSRPFARSGLTVHTPEVAARHLLQVIGTLTPEDSGGFRDWKGEVIPW